MTITYVLIIYVKMAYSPSIDTRLHFQEQTACEEAKEVIIKGLTDVLITAHCIPVRGLLRN